MGIKVTLGGDRLGSGNKNKIALHNYERSTHNLSKKWTSSMTVGALYPFMVIPAMRGDKFDIDLAAAARTIPTQGPLFGSFKMQLDVFQCPVRLYQSILHNNPVDIGLKMAQVKFPKIHCITNVDAQEHYQNMKFSTSCLMKYLGVSGIGRHITTEGQTGKKQGYRDFNAIPLIAYYDIFKNYYSNKQEENAYVISGQEIYETANATKINGLLWSTEAVSNMFTDTFTNGVTYTIAQYFTENKGNLALKVKFDKKVNLQRFIESVVVNFEGTNIHNETDRYIPTLEELAEEYSLISTLVSPIEGHAQSLGSINDKEKYYSDEWTILFQGGTLKSLIAGMLNQGETIATMKPELNYTITVDEIDNTKTGERIKLEAFKLKNIDKMREKILSFHSMGNNFLITSESQTPSENGVWNTTDGEDQSGLPYIINGMRKNTYGNYNEFPLNGLMVKTYQSDLFNNWIDTEWIDGDNGIAAITAIDTSSGEFSIDTLNLSEKLYNMLNRIAVSGGTYEDWQDAVYMQSPRRHLESPVYLGGMSSEVVFEEIVQTAPGGEAGLGSLGGRGILVKRKGGHINVKIDEASFIIGIVSLTPRLSYSQGNKWYMTELDSMDDLHKPALDGIGFQNLMEEQLAWFGTGVSGSSINRGIVGKVPAWINYMTDVDECYGDFAVAEEDEGKAFMVLNRNYEHGENGGISDLTTYIDPTKFNYAFSYTELAAQNFWVQINCDIKARRLMSAKQIPNI